MDSLPRHACQRAAAAEALGRLAEQLSLPDGRTATRYRDGGATGLPISRRRLRNASEPITAGIHSEIAR